MAHAVCLISAGIEGSEDLRTLFERCGLTVWTPLSPDAGDGHIYDDAMCLVIDMPQGAGLRTLRLFRAYGVETPALLIVDPGREVDPETLDCGAVMDVMVRDTNPLRLLRWIQSMCAARTMLQRAQHQKKMQVHAA